METHLTNGSSLEENGLSGKSQSETKSIKLTSYFFEMRPVFLDELNKFLMTNNVEHLKQKWASYQAKDIIKRVALEQAIKDNTVNLLSSKKETHVQDLLKFLESVLLLCQNEMITVVPFVNLLSDIIDSSTLDICEQIFSFVEKNLSDWKSASYFTPGKNTILRMCNDLLRRLSRTQNPVFCGRILVFLAMFFPFSERSGLNIVSEFNPDLLYKDESSEELEPLQLIDVNLKLENDFHEKFWSLQNFFRNPNSCYNSAQWKEFTEIAAKVIAIFKKNKLNKDSFDRLSNHYHSQYFTKFLTSKKLLILELSDSNFRRTLCLQFLFLFHYLTGQIKTKPENHELSEQDLEWVKDVTETIFSLLKDTPPDGEKFVTLAKNMVQREEIWSSWKNEGCPALKIGSKMTPQSTITDSLGDRSMSVLTTQSASGFDTIFVPLKEGPPQPMNLKHSFDSYISSLTPAPELKDFLVDAIDESEKKIDPDKKKVADPSFAWLSVKLISLKAPTFFSNSHAAVPSMSEYVDIMCKKLYRDLNPGLLLPPYMPAPKSTMPKPKKPGVSSGGIAKKTIKKVQGVSGDKTVIKVVKGGLVKLLKTGEGVKVIKDKDGESESSSETKSNDPKSGDSKFDKTTSSKTSKNESSSSKKEEEFSKPSAPCSKQEKHKTDKRSKSPSPKPQKDEKKKEERRPERKDEKKPDKTKPDRGEEKCIERSKRDSKSPGKRKASPRDDDPKTTKVVKVEEPEASEVITKDQIRELAKSIASNWKKLAERLGYQPDEILYFDGKASTDYDRAMQLLLVWVSNEDDATKDNLRKHLKSLGLSNAVSILTR